MIRRIARRSSVEDGFTLIEVMVVMLILGILISIALFTYIGARTKARDREAQETLRSALISAKVGLLEDDTYLPVDETLMAQLEPTYRYFPETTAVVKPTQVSVYPVSDTVWVAVTKSNSGTCFAIRDDIMSATTYAKFATPCRANRAVLVAVFTTDGWTT